MEFLAGARHGVEGPGQLAGHDIEGADIAPRSLRRRFLQAAAQDDQVLVDAARRGDAIAALRQTVHDLRRLELHQPVIAEIVDALSGLGVQRDQEAIDGAEQDAGRMLAITGPVGDAAEGRLIAFRQVIGPELLAGLGVQRQHPAIGRGEIEHTVHFDRRGGGIGQAARTAGRRRRQGVGGLVEVESPGHFQLADIGRRDLGEGREARAAIVIAVIRPIIAKRGGGTCGKCCPANDGCQQSQCDLAHDGTNPPVLWQQHSGHVRGRKADHCLSFCNILAYLPPP